MTEAPRQFKKRLKAPTVPSAPTAVENTRSVAGRTAAIWARVKQNKVVQWTLAYLALAYTLLHGAEMLTGSLGWPHGLLRLFTLILILGVPVVITLAWYHGARGLQRASGTEVMIIALLLAVGGAVLWRDSSTAQHGEQATAVPPPQPASTADSPVASPKSIAVLPFVNMSSEKEQEYFSDGLSEELLNLLSKIPELRVAARTSSFYFKGKDAKLPDIARELQVAHLLEGSVRKSGNRVRITAQLIRASDGYHQWSQTYDRTLDDIFAVQAEIAEAVVSELKATLLGAPPKIHKTTPEAYAFYLQAMQLERQSTGRFEETIALYQKALAIDPSYSPAWLGLAREYLAQADLGVRPVDEGMKLGRETIEKALAIDPNFAAAHAELGWVAMYYDHDLAASAEHVERALALDPTDWASLTVGALLTGALGRSEKLVELMEYAVGRDPLSWRHHAGLGHAYLRARRFDEALTSFRTAAKWAPQAHFLASATGDTLLLKGEFEAALAQYKKEPNETFRLAGLVRAYHALGQKRASDAALKELIDKYPNWAGVIAFTFAYRGETDRAFRWLNRAAALRDATLAKVPTDLWLQSLHDDPRWLPFLRKHGKAPEQLAAIKFELKVPTH